MKRNILRLCLTLFIFASATTILQAKEKKTVIYAFGVSFSFNDKTAFITDIQEVEPVKLYGNGNFLWGREEMAQQLRSYMTSIGRLNRSCVVSFGLTQKQAEKKYAKTKKSLKKKEYIIEYINKGDFLFKPVPFEENADNSLLTKTQKRKLKEAKQKEKK